MGQAADAGEERRPAFHRRLVDFGLQWPEARFSSATDQPCDLGQVPLAPFGVGFSIRTRGTVRPMAHRRREGQDERSWVQAWAAVLVQGAPRFPRVGLARRLPGCGPISWRCSRPSGGCAEPGRRAGSCAPRSWPCQVRARARWQLRKGQNEAARGKRGGPRALRVSCGRISSKWALLRTGFGGVRFPERYVGVRVPACLYPAAQQTETP